MKWSGHAYSRALSRLGVNQFELADYISCVNSKLKRIPLIETENYVTITSIHKGDEYFLAPHPSKNEMVLMIVNNTVIKTILTQDLNIISPLPFVRKDGKIYYKTMPGTIVGY